MELSCECSTHAYVGIYGNQYFCALGTLMYQIDEHARLFPTVCLSSSINFEIQTLPQINVHARLFGTLEYVQSCFKTPNFFNCPPLMARYEKQKWRWRRTKKISNYWKSQRTNWSQWVVPKSSLGIRCLFALLPKFEICAETRLQLFETFIPWLFEKVLFCDTSCFFKVHIFWEGHKILQNFHLTFDWHSIGQK